MTHDVFSVRENIIFREKSDGQKYISINQIILLRVSAWYYGIALHMKQSCRRRCKPQHIFHILFMRVQWISVSY